jgi:hypothetical protein
VFSINTTADGIAAFGACPCWGDYSAVVADESGNVWLANEFVPDAARTVLTNWGTFVSRVHP